MYFASNQLFGSPEFFLTPALRLTISGREAPVVFFTSAAISSVSSHYRSTVAWPGRWGRGLPMWSRRN